MSKMFMYVRQELKQNLNFTILTPVHIMRKWFCIPGPGPEVIKLFFSISAQSQTQESELKFKVIKLPECDLR